MSYLFVILFGLAVGSFLNVCIARLPRHESIVTPRSYCPRCERPIRWYDNIPLVSYLLLRGRCRDCGGRISPLYPAVEIITAGLLVAAWAQYGPGVEFVRSALLCTLLVVLIFTDLTVRKIPHAVTVFGTLAGLLLSLLAPVDDRPLEWLLQSFGVSLQGRTSSFLGAVCGAVFGAGLFFVVGEAFARLRHKEGLGFGDVTLMGMVGTFLGVPLTYVTILLGSLVASVVAVTLYAVSPRFRRDYPWPYGTFLGAAAIYVSLGGPALLNAYLRWGGVGR
jgi:leader peptidase (prepilin peptidase) / N-methyltransferase